MASTFKLAVDKMGATDPYSYIGRKGDIFYDPEFGELRISDGDTPYGAGLEQGIGGSTPTINQVLQVDSTASLEATFAAGIKINTIESLTDLVPVYFTSNVEIDSTITAAKTSFGTLNEINIPNAPGETLATLSNIAGSGVVLESVEQDTAPRLGGDLDTRSFVLLNAGDNDGVIVRQNFIGGSSLKVQDTTNTDIISVTNDVITLKENNWPTVDGTSKQVIKTNGSGQLSYDFVTPFTRYYYYYGGSSPGPGLIVGSDTLGNAFGDGWYEMTEANANTSPGMESFGPTLGGTEFNPNLTGITESNGVFSGFVQGESYHITAEVQIVHGSSSARHESYEMIGSNGNKSKGSIAYLGSGAAGYDDPITVSMQGIYTFEDANSSNNTLSINLHQEQFFQYYPTEAIVNIVRIT